MTSVAHRGYAAGERPLRADARRNREAIVKAARAVFAQHGREAQMDDVARRAKVGVGTLYRHFATKEALLEALAADRMRQLAEAAHDALAIEDPWDALAGYLRRAAELQASDRALSQLLGERPDLMRDAACERGDLRPTLERLVDRARAAGAVRADATWSDIPTLMCALGAAGDWERVLAIFMDGLRAGSPASQG